jgi:hypothetical protein
VNEYSLLVAFPDQSETFVLGFEAGQLFESMKFGPADLTMHAANEEVFRRIARHYGYDVEFEALGDGWSNAKFTRGRPKLHAVPA